MLVKRSFSACISFAWAPANDDSDCATSDNDMFPLSNLILSVSTCLSNKLTFDELITSFSLEEIKPVYASAALYKISCSFFWSFALAKSIPILLFDNSAPLPKSRRVCVTLIDFVSGSTSVIVAFEPSLLVSFSVSSSLLLPSKVIDGR